MKNQNDIAENLRYWARWVISDCEGVPKLNLQGTFARFCPSGGRDQKGEPLDYDLISAVNISWVKYFYTNERGAQAIRMMYVGEFNHDKGIYIPLRTDQIAKHYKITYGAAANMLSFARAGIANFYRTCQM